MNIPTNLLYTDQHIWLAIDGKKATLGITDYAQDEMGDILFVELPETGEMFAAGDTFCEVESSKTTQSLSLPFEFIIDDVNEALEDEPESINEDAYANWIVKIVITSEAKGLIGAGIYEAICE